MPRRPRWLAPRNSRTSTSPPSIWAAGLRPPPPLTSMVGSRPPPPLFLPLPRAKPLAGVRRPPMARRRRPWECSLWELGTSRRSPCAARRPALPPPLGRWVAGSPAAQCKPPSASGAWTPGCSFVACAEQLMGGRHHLAAASLTLHDALRAPACGQARVFASTSTWMQPAARAQATAILHGLQRGSVQQLAAFGSWHPQVLSCSCSCCSNSWPPPGHCSCALFTALAGMSTAECQRKQLSSECGWQEGGATTTQREPTADLRAPLPTAPRRLMNASGAPGWLQIAPPSPTPASTPATATASAGRASPTLVPPLRLPAALSTPATGPDRSPAAAPWGSGWAPSSSWSLRPSALASCTPAPCRPAPSCESCRWADRPLGRQRGAVSSRQPRAPPLSPLALSRNPTARRSRRPASPSPLSCRLRHTLVGSTVLCCWLM